MNTDLRDHLLSIHPELPEHISEAPDAELAPDAASESWCRLVRQHARIIDAARVIERRYQADWNHGGPLTVVAPTVRDAGRDALAECWESVVAVYLLRVQDAAHPST